MLGFSPKSINKTTFNYSSKGFYLLVDGGGYLYSERGFNFINKLSDNDKHIFSSCEISQGTIYGAKWNSKKKEIVYYKNNTELGVGFSDVKLKKKGDFFPSLEFTTANMVVEIIKPKFKK
jgi:hypothetical protein